MLHKADLKTSLTNSIAANCDHRSRGQCFVYAFAFSCDIVYPEKIHQKHYTQIWVVTDYQYGISAAIPERSFLYNGVAKCLLFFQARHCLVFANAESTVNARIMWQDRRRISWGHPWCKILRSSALFSIYYYPWLYCVDFSVASLC